MTLVASFRLREIPILIGDFLLTDNQVNVRHDFLPTIPNIQNTTSTLKRRRVAGLSKKLHKINERLVVGFTGDILPGKELMKALVGQFRDKTLTKAELEEFLSKVEIKNKDKIWLVGWIWEKRPLCFNWYGSRPNEISIVESSFWGSGGQHFIDEIMKSDASRFGHELNTEMEKAIYMAITKAGKILSTELTSATNLDHGYGYGAELILWDGGKFFYVDSIAYQFWDIVINENNELVISPGNTSIIYKNFDTYSALQVSQVGPKADGTGIEAKDTYLNLITPLNDDMPQFDLNSIGRLPFEATYWYTGINIFNPKTGAIASFYHVSDGSEGSLVIYRGGVFYFDPEQLKNMLPKQLFNN